MPTLSKVSWNYQPIWVCTNLQEAEPESLTSVIPTTAIGHNPELVSSTSTFTTFFPQIRSNITHAIIPVFYEIISPEAHYHNSEPTRLPQLLLHITMHGSLHSMVTKESWFNLQQKLG
jgi:hypothetical protein